MLQIGEYTVEYPAYNITPSSVSFTLDWEGTAESLAQLFIDNNFIFTLDEITYREYDIIFNVTKHFGANEGQYTIVLNASMTPKDSLDVILSRNAGVPYSQIVAYRKQLEYITRYLSIDELYQMSWMVADWAPGEVYAIGDIIMYNSEIRKCAESHTASEEFDEHKWLIAQDNEWIEYVEPEYIEPEEEIIEPVEE